VSANKPTSLPTSLPFVRDWKGASQINTVPSKSWLPGVMLGMVAVIFPVWQGRAELSAGPEKPPKGLSASDWSSIRQEYERNRHAAFPTAGGYRARNLGQQWVTRFDGRGFAVEPDAGGWQWGLDLKSYGFPGHQRAVSGRARVTAAKDRVSYDWDHSLQEWFVNDQRGLEHGFTLRERPAGTGQRLELHLAVRGGLRPRVQSDGLGAGFLDSGGARRSNTPG